MMDKIDPAKILRVAITGHRPGDLFDADGHALDPQPAIADFLHRAGARGKASGRTRVRVVTGGALGIDQAVAAAVAAHPDVDGIRFDYAVFLPFPIEIMGARWSAAARAYLVRLCAGAAELPPPVSPTYAAWAYGSRNRAMVDSSAFVVGFWSGIKKGGTYNCLHYAVREAKPPRAAYNALDDFRKLTTADL